MHLLASVFYPSFVVFVVYAERRWAFPSWTEVPVQSMIGRCCDPDEGSAVVVQKSHVVEETARRRGSELLARCPAIDSERDG
ncbi:hypothetical protein HPB50_002600 [Hyalomma asiaticum]|uniref:Uncharacterized protein n=1 Tax=Hyalomma asiaticum TaxID=266040 RepID=A0ACB7SBE5_HYAAI|nr:hypothetical protein HPB50_002600 [Hyalomma asiaticum]